MFLFIRLQGISSDPNPNLETSEDIYIYIYIYMCLYAWVYAYETVVCKFRLTSQIPDVTHRVNQIPSHYV